MTIVVDSLGTEEFFGRMTRYFSGDAGIDPARFRPFTGSVREDSNVSFAISTLDQPAARLAFAGQLRGNTIHVSSLTLGPDELLRTGRRYFFVKQR